MKKFLSRFLSNWTPWVFSVQTYNCKKTHTQSAVLQSIPIRLTKRSKCLPPIRIKNRHPTAFQLPQGFLGVLKLWWAHRSTVTLSPRLLSSRPKQIPTRRSRKISRKLLRSTPKCKWLPLKTLSEWNRSKLYSTKSENILLTSACKGWNSQS